MAVGEVFLGAFLQVLFQKLAEGALMALARQERIDSYFKKLRQSFRFILAVLEDAEDRQLTEKSVKLWLEILRDLAYDLDDMMDEIITRALVQGSNRIQPHKTSMVSKLIPTCSKFMPGALVSNYKFMSRMKDITNRLNSVAKDRIELNLRENLGGQSNRLVAMRLPSTSLVIESDVLGRDEDKEAIKYMLLRDEDVPENFTVIPIVGMGGIGKTTLTQLVYNDRSIKQNFHIRSWVCVSEEFNVLMITKTILESITGDSDYAKDLNMLQVNLQDKLSKSRFLIVLDDVWNENYENWELLCRPFQSGLSGSRIIVTTRNDTVALVVGAPRSAFHMKLLTDANCLSLLSQHARTCLDKDSNLRDVGLGLVKKCKGLPLAAKTLGGLLRSKESESEWIDILNSKIWDLPEKNNILPVLRLSYHHLPSHLKHPFAYCSVFPKDCEFDKNELVSLWMGEGFLEHPNKDKRKEDLGLEYFNELLSRSFFQRLTDNDSNFVMHDLINDLAHFVSGETCYHMDEKLDTNQEYRLPENARHASFLRHEYEVYSKFEGFQHVPGLRTFLPMPVQNSLVWPPFFLSNRILVELVPRLRRLRVLSLSGYSITELPSSVCNLLHLRYFNLSETSIVTLPDSISDLVNLQTLSLRNCRFIRKLPSTLGDLDNLRHLDISNTDKLIDMPVEIGKLKSLQTLPKIVLSKVGGLGLKELEDLKLLRGTLAILELQNISDLEDAKDASLRCKKELDDLHLAWGSDSDYSNATSSENVIEFLQPHENLRKLKIEFYSGVSFPHWIGDPSFHQLTSMSLSNCSRCTSLPPLGQLPRLKHLLIRSMPKIKCIGSEFYGKGVVPFQKLETLRFDRMTQLEEWSFFADGQEIQMQFPLLYHLTLFRCEKLNYVSPLSFYVLRELDLAECGVVVLKSFHNLDSLAYLKVEAITGLSHLPTELIKYLPAIEVLECCCCNEMLSVWPDEIVLEQLTKLRRLVIADCKQLVSLGNGKNELPCNLEDFELFGCANLVSLSNDLRNLRYLRELIIKNCPKFVSFPEDGIPPSLKRLEVLSCNALEYLPSNISDLERLEIKECSSLKTWKADHFPTNLKKLSVKNCQTLESVTDLMFPKDSAIFLEDLSLCNWLNFDSLLQNLFKFSHLVELYLSGCSGLKYFPDHGLPPSLRALSIEDCATLRSLPANIRSMKSVVSLEIRSCPRLDKFPSCDFPPNLSSLRIWDSKRFKSLNEWGLRRLASLREFSICGGFRELELLDGVLFPPSLVKLSIARFPKLSSISKGVENLSFLRHLSIMNCVELSLLPSEHILEKLWHLEISECPNLSKRCLKDKGDFWSKISGIPCVVIDGT